MRREGCFYTIETKKWNPGLQGLVFVFYFLFSRLLDSFFSRKYIWLKYLLRLLMFDIFLFLLSHLTITFLFHSILHQNSVDIASLPSVILCYEKNFNMQLLYNFFVGNLFIILPLFMQNFVSFIFEIKTCHKIYGFFSFVLSGNQGPL